VTGSPDAGLVGGSRTANQAAAFAVDPARGWFPVDAANHRRDAPRYCPACAAPLALADGGHGLATEYWVAADRVFVCYCAACRWTGDIGLTSRVVSHEPHH
jgi:hypothetical protein